MDIQSFATLAMHSADVYYSYLAQNGRGVSEVHVSDVVQQEDGYLLYLKTKLSDTVQSELKDCIFSIRGYWYTSHQIVPLEYDASAVTLLVRPHPAWANVLSGVLPRELVLLHDLKYLVKRVEKWYQTHGRKIHLPDAPPEVPPLVLPSGIQPSPQQLSAIKGALSSPFSYVWGAPGTGKTRVVLATCVSSLVSAKRKILLLAPTNNALEQMLSGVIPACLDAGISSDQILRLGTPTSSFFAKYPEVCEERNTEKRIESLKKRISHIQKCFHFRSFTEQYDLASQQLPGMLDELLLLHSSWLQTLDEQKRLALSMVHDQAEDTILREETNQLLKTLHGHQTNVANASSLKKFLRPKWFSNEVSAVDTLLHTLQENRHRMDILSAKISSVEEKISESKERTASLERDFSSLLTRLQSLTAFWSALKNAAASLSLDATKSGVQAVKDSMDAASQIVFEKRLQYADLASLSLEELSIELQQSEAKLSALLSHSTDERLKHTTVLASTIDRFLTLDLLSGPFHPDHVFLDEAGYCSLIKGVTPFSLGVPVTFLGDHMQLPPICELNDDKIQSETYQSVCLWSQSAIYAECVFSCSFPRILSDYLENIPAPFQIMSRFALDATFRFGSSLASILASSVYTESFHSLSPTGTELLVLNAPRNGSSSARSCAAEAETIKSYLLKTDPGDFAILTPYRDQLSLLSSRLPVLHKAGRILTIHASQGREWDTVFLSIVDTTNKWFTDSRRPMTRGKMVINTAVSRARKRLILVCDAAYWQSQPGQLIGKIVSASRELDVL